jgi:iron complex outermembrane receptor protein
MSSRKLAAVLGASMLSLAAASVSAQTAPAAQDNAQQADTDANTPGDASKVIVVTGYARSLATALRAKRDSVAVIESLSAEDVGKLPDVSIADAISRLPGVAVQTQQGRGEMISIRGFSGDFTGALLNHREIATIDDNRRFDYSQLPGDMFNRVDVIKTSSANVLGMGLAGTVDLMSIDPLSNKRILSINLQGELNGYAKQNPDQTNKGYKATFIYSDKFADDTLGITIGASAIESPVQNKQFASWGYPTSASGNYQLGGAKWFADTNVLYRQTGFGHIVYKPSDKLEVSSTRCIRTTSIANISAASKCLWPGAPARSRAMSPPAAVSSRPRPGRTSMRSSATTTTRAMPIRWRLAVICATSSTTSCASRWTPAIRGPSATTMPMKPTPAPATTVRASPIR